MEIENRKEAKQKLVQYMNNPKAFTLKKWFIELLKERYNKHDPIIERVALSLSTDADLKDFGALIAEVFEAGYFKAVADYREQAEKAGMQVRVVTPNS